MLLLSRSGAAADGAAELAAGLRELGCEAEIVACDASDRAAVKRALASIPAERPLGAVVHCAGALADATVETMDGEQLGASSPPRRTRPGACTS